MLKTLSSSSLRLDRSSGESFAFRNHSLVEMVMNSPASSVVSTASPLHIEPLPPDPGIRRVRGGHDDRAIKEPEVVRYADIIG